ncbi:MAG: hypothetical protein CMI53_04265 [Parcubacteria group bacterium]|nr:hypothetical protein [Parcubacteria group bacterium]
MTTRCVVADDKFGLVAKRCWELQRRVREGTIDPDVAAEAIQAIMEDKSLPAEMTIGDRTYEILGFLRGDEKSVPGSVMVERAKEMQANLGQDDGQYLLDHQEEIPQALRGKVVFVFPDWRRPGDPGCVACVDWRGNRWVQDWYWLDCVWYDIDRVLRRK